MNWKVAILILCLLYVVGAIGTTLWIANIGDERESEGKPPWTGFNENASPASQVGQTFLFWPVALAKSR